MSRYYTKKQLSVPTSRLTFNPETIDATISKFDDRFKGRSPDELKKMFEKLYQVSTLEKFRLSVFGVSKILSDKGIAPRWQGILEAGVTNDQEAAIKADTHLYDLYWLSVTFPKHKTINKRWQSIFTHGFDFELALSIGERQIHTARKVQHELNLSTHQQLGCIHFYRQGRGSPKERLRAAEERAKTAYNREIRRIASTPQLSEEIAEERAFISQCWLLGDESPTRAAEIYKWMSGKDKDKSTIKRTAEKMKRPVSRPHSDITAPHLAASETSFR